MLLTLDYPRFPLCGQFIINYMDNLLLEQHIYTIQFEIQIYQINFNQLFTQIFISNGFSLLYFFPSGHFMNLSHGHLWIAPFSLGSLARAILGNLRAGLSYHSKIIAIIPRSSSLPTMRLGH